MVARPVAEWEGNIMDRKQRGKAMLVKEVFCFVAAATALRNFPILAFPFLKPWSQGASFHTADLQAYFQRHNSINRTAKISWTGFTLVIDGRYSTS